MAVRMVPGRVRKALFTAHELEKIQANTGKGYELVRGELYDGAPPGFRHGEIQGRTYRKVRNGLTTATPDAGWNWTTSLRPTTCCPAFAAGCANCSRRRAE